MSLPDPKTAAGVQINELNGRREAMLRTPVDRVLSDCPGVEREQLLAGLTAFHRERMASIPDPIRYPESRSWCDYVIEVDRLVEEGAGLTGDEMALLRSLPAYLTFRGYARYRPAATERCRIAFIPCTDHGPLHIKNVDDPLINYQPSTVPPAVFPCSARIVWDGVGSGMRLDDEPEDIFPLPVRAMCFDACGTLSEAADFLARYSCFWGGMNVLLHDQHGNSCAIDKTSYNYIDVHVPDPCGGSHVSGNVLHDPSSEQGRYVARKRREYIDRFGLADDCTDVRYWRACRRAEELLAALMSRAGIISVDDVVDIFKTPWPEGFNKGGVVYHPDQATSPEYTLVLHYSLLAERTYVRWQRDIDGRFPDKPNVYRYDEE